MLRKVTGQNGGEMVYSVPETEHWAGWRDADAVAYHGRLVAFRDGRRWYDADGDRVDGRRYAALRSVGITTRR